MTDLFFVWLKDALFFLKDFFASLATEVEFFSPPAQEGKAQNSDRECHPGINTQ